MYFNDLIFSPFSLLTPSPKLYPLRAWIAVATSPRALRLNAGHAFTPHQQTHTICLRLLGQPPQDTTCVFIPFLVLPCPCSSSPWSFLRLAHPSGMPLFSISCGTSGSPLWILFPYLHDNLFEVTESQGWACRRIYTGACTVLTSQQAFNMCQWTWPLLSEYWQRGCLGVS